MRAKITVAIPSFNHGRYLNEALESIFTQQLPVEVMLADAGSNDETASVIDHWRPRLSWWRSFADAGQSAAINEAIAQGTAPYVCWLNADDRYCQGGLMKLLNVLKKRPDKPAVYGRSWNINSAGVRLNHYWTGPFSRWRLAQHCFISQPTVLIRRNVWEALGGLDETLDMVMDYDLWWRIYKNYGELVFVSAVIAENRLHGDTKTATRRRQHYIEAMRVVKHYYGSVPLKWYLMWPWAVWWRSRQVTQNDTNYPYQVNSLYRTSILKQSQEVVPGWKQLWRKLLHLGRCSLRQARYGYYKLRDHLRRLRDHLRRLFGPRIGLLVHYKPRSLQLTKYHLREPLTTQTCPHISIITPSFQQGEFIERTINSVLNQDYPNLEYIVQDGSSTDETVTILRNYNEQLSYWQSQSDNGQAHAINLGFKRSSGDIMMWLNSDDMLMPGALHHVAEYFDCHPEVDVVYSHRILIDEQDNDIGRWILPHHNNKVLSWVDFIPQETLFWRREIWNRIGGYLDENYLFALDWDLLIRFREAGAVFKRLPCFLGAFRVHENQKTNLVMDELGDDEMKRIRKRCLGKEVTQHEIRKNIANYLLQHCAYHLLFRVSNILNKPIY